MGYSLRLLLSTKPEDAIEGMRQAILAATELQLEGESYKHAIDRPGGQEWDGKAATAAQDTAAADEKVVYGATEHVRDEGNEALNTLAFKVKESHSKPVGIYNDMTSHGYTVSEDLKVDWIVPARTTPELTAQGKKVAERVTREIRAAYDTWWAAEEEAQAEIRAIINELNTSYNPLASLTAAQGREDGAKLTNLDLHDPAILARVKAAASMTDEELNAIANGKDVTIGSNRMQYLYQLAQALNGKTPEELALLKSALPMGTQSADHFMPTKDGMDAPTYLARALSIVSDDHVKSGVSNVSGVTDATKNNFIPTAGSVTNLSDTVRGALTRTDRIGGESAGMTGTGTTQLRGVGDLQDVAKLFGGAGEYLNGSEAGKALLGAASDYTNADINAQKADLPVEVRSDAHGDLKSALAGVYDVASNDHRHVAELAEQSVGGHKDADSFLKAVNGEHWGEDGSKVAKVLDWAAQNPNDPMAGKLANSEAHFMADNKAMFQDLPGNPSITELAKPDTFGNANPDIAKAAFGAIAPHEAQLAGAGPDSGFHNSDIKALEGGEQLRNLYSIADQNHDSAQIANAEGHRQYEQLVGNATAPGGPHGNELEVGGRLLHGMGEGAADQMSASPEGSSEAAKQLLGKMPGFSHVQDAKDFINSLMHKPPDDFAQQLAHANTGTLAFQTTILDGLLQNHPEIAHDPLLKEYVKDGHVNYDVVRDNPNVAAGRLTDWFNTTAKDQPYHIDQNDFAAQRDRGNSDDWALGPR